MRKSREKLRGNIGLKSETGRNYERKVFEIFFTMEYQSVYFPSLILIACTM